MTDHLKDVAAIFAIYEPDGKGDCDRWHWTRRSAELAASSEGPTWKVSEWLNRVEVEAALRSLVEERDRAKANLASLEDEKNAYIDYVGDALGQDDDRETLWDAAQRVLSERDSLRAQLSQQSEEIEGLRRDEKTLRDLLFGAHGNEEHYLYGDDGERVCNACGSDFKRDTPKQLMDKITAYNMKKLAGLWPVAIPDAAIAKEWKG